MPLYWSAFINWPVAWSVNALCGPTIVPVGTLTFQFLSAVSISLMPICRAASRCGSSCTCTAYFSLPSTCTCATPLTMEMRWAIRVSAYSSSVHAGIVVDVIDEIEDGLIGRIHLRERRRRRHALRQQARGLRDRGLHVHRGAIERPVEVELERDLRGPERVHRRHRLQAGDRRELVLERRRHRRGHRLRAGAGQLRRDEQRREVHVRQVAHRQRPVRDHAEERDGGHEQARRDRPLDESFRNVHVSSSSAGKRRV